MGKTIPCAINLNQKSTKALYEKKRVNGFGLRYQ